MMERVFVDTSAFYAVMDRSDRLHAEAARNFAALLEGEFELITTNYVVLETVALIQSRLGFEAAKLWTQRILGIVQVHFVDEPLQEMAFNLWLGLASRQVSLVDCASFVFMRRAGLEEAFAFDGDFEKQGFRIFRA